MLPTEDPVRLVRRRQTETERWIPVVLTGIGERFPAQLWNSRQLADVKKFVAESYGSYPPSALRRFLAGEFTDGHPPIRIPKGRALDVERICSALDVLEAMAARWRLALSAAPLLSPTDSPQIGQADDAFGADDSFPPNGPVDVSSDDIEPDGSDDGATLSMADSADASDPNERRRAEIKRNRQQQVARMREIRMAKRAARGIV